MIGVTLVLNKISVGIKIIVDNLMFNNIFIPFDLFICGILLIKIHLAGN
jgi:hypothetical protein